eukprot:TRINITY_DN10117_c0_g1_i2.p1 TRINITY_DN10117_c0_g1~~TRINITY_DN10117_c0_g1_i2.p1  ORF type:complete len:279 (-),score=27.76 TRINITY_DN10117_c0_g1_i2:85-921(-)
MQELVLQSSLGVGAAFVAMTVARLYSVVPGSLAPSPPAPIRKHPNASLSLNSGSGSANNLHVFSRRASSITELAQPQPYDGPTASIMAVLGSGGHTAEMLKLMGALDCRNRYTPRHYVIAATDPNSRHKLNAFEATLTETTSTTTTTTPGDTTPQQAQAPTMFLHTIPRSREVGQSFFSALFTTFVAFLHALYIVCWSLPDVILCNGPGTCVPIVMAAYIPRLLGIKNIRLVYIESIARVETLSLSGRLLLPYVDDFLVQWPELATRHPKATYLGRLL